MTRTAIAASLVCLALLGSAAPAGAATITVVNVDGTGEGFNDPTAATPVGGNNGTTLGAQRLNVMTEAARLWALAINSVVEIRVQSSFDPLPCGSFGAVLGAALSIDGVVNFTGAPLADTLYPVALANSLAGSDLTPNTDDILAFFSSSIGTTCPLGVDWYYGLDGNPPPGTVDLLTVVLHEFGHGLGFATFTNLATGAKFDAPGLGPIDDVFSMHLENHQSGKIYPDMSDAERVTASVCSGALHWVGSAVTGSAGDLSSGTHSSCHVQMYAPRPAEPGSSVSHFSTSLFPNELMEPFITGVDRDLDRTLQVFADLGWSVNTTVCGDATLDGAVASTDSLAALATSVGSGSCSLKRCDVNASSTVTATDALLILQVAVGQEVALVCGAQPGSCASSSVPDKCRDDTIRRPNSPRPVQDDRRPAGNFRPDEDRPLPDDR